MAEDSMPTEPDPSAPDPHAVLPEPDDTDAPGFIEQVADVVGDLWDDDPEGVA
jgi:hypothetical protein